MNTNPSSDSASSIKWNKKSWNPFTGCQPVSAGCQFCYAKAIATGKRGCGGGLKTGFDLALHPERLSQPLNNKTPSVYFVNSMSDLFWEAVPPDMVKRIFDVIEATPWHTYQIQTKRPERMLAQSVRRPFPSNIWAGVTVENQAEAWRVDVLRKVKAHVRYLSCEPLLSALTLDWSAVNWVITGGETGSHLLDPVICGKRGLVENVRGAWRPRSDRMDWVRQIRDGCHAAGTLFYHKQWGCPWYDKDHNWLDGKQWEQFPAISAVPRRCPQDKQMLIDFS
jgi:protein gp37